MSLEQNNYASFSDHFDSSSHESKTMGNRDTLSATEPSEPPNQFHRRVWIVVMICSLCFVISTICLNPLSIQFFSYRIAEEKYNFIYIDSNKVGCSNASSTEENLIDRVQKDASHLILLFSAATGVPACFTTFLVGSYSDYMGRKPILIMSIFGGFVKMLVLTFIVKFDWNIRLYFIGAVVDGMCGTYFTFILGVTAIIADITPSVENRALNFAVLDGTLVSSAAVALVGIGYLIKDQGFFVPVLILCGLMVVSMLVTVFLLPETMQWKRAVTWNPKVHVKKVLGFYLLSKSSRKRLLYISALCAFTLMAFTTFGRPSVETLYELSDPLCWDPVQIGFYSAIKSIGSAIVTIAFMRVVKYRLSLELTGLVCAVSGIASTILFGLSQSSAGLYIAALVGCVYLGSVPIPRALLSQLTPETEQGLAMMETAANLVSSTVFTLIYNNTIDSFKGAVFMFIAAVIFINFIFLVVFRLTRSSSSLSDYKCFVEPGTDVKTRHNSLPSEETVLDESSNLIAK